MPSTYTAEGPPQDKTGATHHHIRRRPSPRSRASSTANGRATLSMWKSNEIDHHSQGLATSRRRPVAASHPAVRFTRIPAARRHIQPKARVSPATTLMSWSQSKLRLCGPIQ